MCFCCVSEYRAQVLHDLIWAGQVKCNFFLSLSTNQLFVATTNSLQPLKMWKITFFHRWCLQNTFRPPTLCSIGVGFLNPTSQLKQVLHGGLGLYPLSRVVWLAYIVFLLYCNDTSPISVKLCIFPSLPSPLY